MFTTAISRPLLSAAVSALLTLGLFTAPAHASRGVYQCNGSLEIPQTAEQLATASSAVSAVNIERAARGIDSLRRDADLAQAARGHALEMTQRQFFSHVSTNGNQLSDRVRAAGYGDPGDGWKVGEDIGWGSGQKATPAWIVQAWLDSPPHRRILLSQTYVELGVGVISDTPKATQLPGATYAMDLGVLRP